MDLLYQLSSFEAEGKVEKTWEKARGDFDIVDTQSFTGSPLASDKMSVTLQAWVYKVKQPLIDVL